ncbi:MAG: helix-turn-helix transcriptional regulator [Caldimonas sp.]
MNTNDVARIAALVGEPSRTAMLIELIDGRALTANELARAAHVQAPAASRHLALLVEGGLLQVEPRGRHRYHRLASAEVACVLEGIMQLAVAGRAAGQVPRRAVVTGPREAAMRRARTCYDHIAGRLGVAIADRLLADGAVTFDGTAGHVEAAAEGVLARLGIDTGAASASTTSRVGKRPHCRPCLDWSERKPHLAGSLGALICAHCLERRWLLRHAGGRGLEITAPGEVALREWLGAALWQRVAEAGAGR